MIRSKKFLTVQSTILNASATALVPTLTSSITEIEALRTGQVTGNGQLSGGVAERRLIAKELRQMLVDIAKTARVLAKAGNPGLDEELRVPRTRKYSELLGAGDAFVAVLTPEPVQSLFTARGFDETFVEDLSAKAEAFRDATERKHGGLNEKVGSTTGLVAAVREGVAVVRDLDAILGPQLRKTDPVLHGSWKAAIHVAKPRREKKPAGESPEAPQLLAAAVESGEPASSDPAAPAIV